MIISKTPVRISIGGGGTDLPSFYKKFGSYFISAAIDKYIYIIVQERRYEDKFLLKYSKIEAVTKINQIKNEIIRECLNLMNIKRPIEIVSISDVGGLTGLGSSGAFTVGLLHALHAFNREHVSRKQLSEEALSVTMRILDCGKQDEYIATFGGLSSFTINKSGKVEVACNEFDQDFVRELEHYLYMFHTGIKRKSKEILSIQQKATEAGNEQVINNLQEVQKLGFEIRDALKTKKARVLGELLHKHWILKKKRAKTTNKQINDWYELAYKNGVLGGKIMGAGGGGFFLFYCDKNGRHLIETLTKTGLKHVPFRFDYYGTRLIADF